MNDRSIHLAAATPADLPDIQALILALAEYERLAHLCVATEAQLHDALFGERPAAEVQIARIDGDSGPAIGFALFCHTFSTFLGRRTLWLEDLYVRPEQRGRGVGRALLRRLASHRQGARLRSVRMGGAGLEHAVDRVLQEPGRAAARRLDASAASRATRSTAWLRHTTPERRRGDGMPGRCDNRRLPNSTRRGHRTPPAFARRPTRPRSVSPRRCRAFPCPSTVPFPIFAWPPTSGRCASSRNLRVATRCARTSRSRSASPRTSARWPRCTPTAATATRPPPTSRPRACATRSSARREWARATASLALVDARTLPRPAPRGRYASPVHRRAAALAPRVVRAPAAGVARRRDRPAHRRLGSACATCAPRRIGSSPATAATSCSSTAS